MMCVRSHHGNSYDKIYGIDELLLHHRVGSLTWLELKLIKLVDNGVNTQ